MGRASRPRSHCTSSPTPGTTLSPWRSGGITTNASSSLTSFVIADGAHHVDLFFTDPADPPSITAARAYEVSAFTGWIAEWYAAEGARASGAA